MATAALRPTEPDEAPASAPELSRPHAIDGRLVYAIGDIHGCYDALRTLLDQIAQNVAFRADGRLPVLIFCGDYVDRGPDSMRVIDAMCWLQRHCPYERHFLKGNHEKVFLDFIADPSVAADWLRFGGQTTLRSYGIEAPEVHDPYERQAAARDDLLEKMPVSHLRFLEGLETMVTLGDYAFVHAGVRPTVPLELQRERDLLWIREPFLGHAAPADKVIVHGHTWHDAEPDVRDGRIGIDTGTYETGVLTALRVEDGRIGFLQTR